MTHVEVSSFNDALTMPCYPEICTSTSCRYHPQTSAGGLVSLVSTAWLTSGLPSHCSTMMWWTWDWGSSSSLTMSILPRACWKSVGKCPFLRLQPGTACGFHCQHKSRVGVTHPRYEVQDALENQKAWVTWYAWYFISPIFQSCGRRALRRRKSSFGKKKNSSGWRTCCWMIPSSHHPIIPPWPAPLVGWSHHPIISENRCRTCTCRISWWNSTSSCRTMRWGPRCQRSEKTWGKHQRILLQIPATPASYCISRYFKQFWTISSFIICLEIIISIVRAHANFCDLSESKWAHSWPPWYHMVSP